MRGDLNSQSSHLEKLGRRILAEANDLKRTPEALANELGYELSVIKSVISGRADLEVVQTLLSRMCDKYPISLAKVWLDQDDTNDGIKIMRAEESKSTSRVFCRKNSLGEEASYYEYRDTVMSRTAAFRPEWIQPIRVVSDNSPDHPDVAFNRGHLMHQCTFFIGEVNFYWEIDGKKYSAEMNTGDSNYITPFVPHSFTSRNPNQLGLIIAITFGSEVCNAMNELTKIGALGMEEISDKLNNKSQAFKSRLNRFLNAESLGERGFIDRLIFAGMNKDHACQIAKGEKLPSRDDINNIANVLSVHENDLSVVPIDRKESVVVKQSDESEYRLYPDTNIPAYQLKELARTPNLPYLRGHDVTILGNGEDAGSYFYHHLHEYLYNYGDVPVQICWHESNKEVINPGDSAYIQPMVKHRFTCSETTKPGHLVSLRIPGALTDSVINEFSRYPIDHRQRTIEETDKWY